VALNKKQVKKQVNIHHLYQILTNFGLRSIIKSFARFYILDLLYREPQGLTSTMIYCNYKESLSENNSGDESTRSRSNIIDHLNELESEHIIEKGVFKQYMLTDKGRKIYEISMKLAEKLRQESMERPKQGKTEKKPPLG
jgi:predicted transcriptional regulator